MKNINISIIQTELAWEDKPTNLNHFETCLQQVPEDSRLVILPEMFTTGFSMNPKKLAEKMSGESVEWMRKQAISLNKTIVGSVIIEENKQYYNRLIWMKPDGKFQYYNKHHCFRYADEHLHYTGGDKELIVELEGWQFACYICYDLRFPVWSRNTNLKYDVALYIANWPAKRSEHWKTLLKARAIENQAYTIGVNRIGNDGKGFGHSGDSIVLNGQGEQISNTESNKFSIETITLNANELIDYRNKFPAWMDAD
tara:strand:+ start:11638 stop:12402 length:765 start_codon:yes stop_codon:yes gene_type:complete